jgi:DNA-binding HxlR family transcriptional regulator
MTDPAVFIYSSIAAGLDVIGDRWTLLLLRDAFLGRTRFEEFKQHTGASRATLSRRLNSLVIADVMYKKRYGNRYEYKLTEIGLRLFPTSLLSWNWEASWSDGIDYQLPLSLFHTRCGHNFKPRSCCSYCMQAIEINTIDSLASDQPTHEQLTSLKLMSKRRVRGNSQPGSQSLSLTHISDIIGDRWTLLILITSFLGIKRYDSYQKVLSIASNILAVRLTQLVNANILERHTYQDSPPRQEYCLTNKGNSLFPIVMYLRQWSQSRTGQTEDQLIHKSCGKPLKIEVQCAHCQKCPDRQDIEFHIEKPKTMGPMS